MGRFHHQEPRFPARGRGHPYARRILDLRLGDRAHADRHRLHAAIGRLSRAAARNLPPAQTEAGSTELRKPTEPKTTEPKMKPADVCIAVLVAVIWGLAFVASRIALNE